jgi:DNA topoisomerase-2
MKYGVFRTVGLSSLFESSMLPALQRSLLTRFSRSKLLNYRHVLQSCALSAKRKDSLDVKYEKKSPIEHILMRPGMYVGQIDLARATHWVYDSKQEKMVKMDVTYSPALLKIFDEIIVNAADNVQRDANVTQIRVNINSSEVLKDNSIPLKVVIENDGKNIPIKLHPKENIYIPELIFGHLLTGSNFDDTSSRLTGGSHGYGAKLTNIFSHAFQVEIFDSLSNTYYQQKWKDNMAVCHPPKLVSDYQSSSKTEMKNFVRITFEPDLNKFGFSGLSKEEKQNYLEDLLSLLHRRTLDVAGCLHKINVYYNNDLIPVKSFHDYVQYFSPKELPPLERSHEESSSTFSKDPESSSSEVSASPASLSKDIPVLQLNNRLEFSVLPVSLVHQANSLESLSFVNNVWTSRGGSHVNTMLSSIVDYISDYLKKNYPNALKSNASASSSSSSSTVLSNIIKNNLFLFVNCKIENPSFDGQTKDALLTKPVQFQSYFNISNKQFQSFFQFENNYYHSLLLQSILNDISFQEHYKVFQSLNKNVASMAKNKSKLMIQVSKLEDAHYAGSAKNPLETSMKCTLILTEGDSAKALAIAGLSTIGRDYHGVLPLRGKVLNVRAISRTKQLLQNQELMNLCKSMNLQFDKKYETNEEYHELRYGSILLMCDQDYDGSHIKGLVINFIHYFWPALLQRKGFLQEFITPIVKIRELKKSSSSADDSILSPTTASTMKAKNTRAAPSILSFFNLSEYEEWKLKNLISPEQKKLYSIKYYKGLGTNTNEEGKEYFQNIETHQKYFLPDGKESNLIDLVFNKTRAPDRKGWLLENYSPDLFIDFNEDPLKKNAVQSIEMKSSSSPSSQAPLPYLTYTDFINKELIHFSFSDNVRSIPSLIDGLKPSQRKVLFGSFLKFPSSSSSSASASAKEMKVMQLAGFIAEKTSYHHGEQSLHSTIVNMAQQFVGSNNLPFLVGIGQFGTRSKGGVDFASPRYIYTRLSPMTRCLFPAEDDILLVSQEDDGIPIEPKYYLPILPTVLLNGVLGIGTGWSTSIPSYNILDIIQYLERKIKKEQQQNRTRKSDSLVNSPLVPFVYGFKGRIYSDENNNNNVSSEKSIKSYVSEGNLVIHDKTQIEINELPINKWTEDFKEYLLKLIEKNEIKSFQEFHTIHSVKFMVKLSAANAETHILVRDTEENDVTTEQYDRKKTKKVKELAENVYNNQANQKQWISFFKLTSNILLSNMYLFNDKNQIEQYHSPEEIIDAFYPLRLQGYHYRKQILLKDFYSQFYYVENQKTFLNVLLQGKEEAKSGKSKSSFLEKFSDMNANTDLPTLMKSYSLLTEEEISVKVLQKMKELFPKDLFPKLAKNLKDVKTGSDEETVEDQEEEEESEENINERSPTEKKKRDKGYDYLLRLPIQSMTKEQYQSYEKKLTEVNEKIVSIEKTNSYELWLEDLKKCREKYLQVEKEWRFD